ncbi:MAG: RecX family transcriptional regulator [Prevotellaceae bacterium]|nr:RecX family transcriptional regulator [Prevotellaceae bacterium]
MKHELTYDEALHRAAAYCTASEKCAFDVSEKLSSWGVSEEESEKIIAYLTKENFISEERFACAFVNDKFRFNKWGRIKIDYALRAKNISTEVIQSALAGIDENEYSDTLTGLLKAKLRGLQYKDEYDKRAKLFRFAQGRGFESKEIQKSLQVI